mmetsp:Transcript_29994/g.64817  ORF Transcript_29994/g.64817 Transcript_29994/m.64817 type:complete len:203 (-) Transcript_29994:28-636(-)
MESVPPPRPVMSAAPGTPFKVRTLPRTLCYQPNHSHFWTTPPTPGTIETARTAVIANPNTQPRPVEIALTALWRRQGRPLWRETETRPEERPLSVSSSCPELLALKYGPKGSTRGLDLTYDGLDRRADSILGTLVKDGRNWSLAQRQQAQLFDKNAALREANRSSRLKIAGARRETLPDSMSLVHREFVDPRPDPAITCPDW